MKEFEKWEQDEGLMRCHLCEKAFQAGMAHYAQGDLAGDERRRIMIWLRDIEGDDYCGLAEIADRLERGES